MSTAVSVFKFSVPSVCQLQDFKVSFEMTGLPYQWSPVANVASQYRTHMIIQWAEIWRLKCQQGYFKVRIAVKLVVHFEKSTFTFK